MFTAVTTRDLRSYKQRVFNIGSGELALIAVVALLVLGPKRLPELARGIGKALREFRKQTDEVRGVVEREFYRMDAAAEETFKISPAEGAVSQNPEPGQTLSADTANTLPPGSTAPVDTAAIAAAAAATPVPLDESEPGHPNYGRSEQVTEELADPGLSVTAKIEPVPPAVPEPKTGTS